MLPLVGGVGGGGILMNNIAVSVITQKYSIQMCDGF